MRIVMFETADMHPAIGILEDDDIIDVTDWIANTPGTPLLRSFLEKAATEPPPANGPRRSLSEVSLLPPAWGAETVMCVGVNYAEHGRRVAEKHGQEFDPSAPPSLFTKVWSSLAGHGQPLVRPTASTWLDFEGELVVVIGKECRSVRREDALEVVAGYSIGNDGSIRDWQRNLPTPTAGKNFSQSGAMGPYIVTVDELPQPEELHLITTLNGEVMQNAPVSDLMNDIPTLIEHITSFMPLFPGDVIFTGTPGGSFSDRGNDRWLVPGDEISVSIAGLGSLTNHVVAEEDLGTL